MKSLQNFYKIYRDSFDPIYFSSLSRRNKRKYINKMGTNAKKVFLGDIFTRSFYDYTARCYRGNIVDTKLFNNILKGNIQNSKTEHALRIEKYKGIPLKRVLYTLNSCYTLNKNVKKNAYSTHREQCECHGFEGYHCHRCYGAGEYEHTDVDYDLRDEEYKNKTKAIQRCINAIRVNCHPIKYGQKAGVIYFEYLGKQVSFHDPDGKICCKPFQGEWNGVRNKKVPFILKINVQ